jgi:hypothetical protein
MNRNYAPEHEAGTKMGCGISIVNKLEAYSHCSRSAYVGGTEVEISAVVFVC